MGTMQQLELKLAKTYDEELGTYLEGCSEAAKAGKQPFQLYLREAKRKLEIFEKQVLKCKELFPDDEGIQFNEMEMYYQRGVYKVVSSMYYEMYPGFFSPSSNAELGEALKHFNASLEICENPDARRGLVLCYLELRNKKQALQELDIMLERYADVNEKAYLWARKRKDELETSSGSTAGRFVRGLFGRV